MVSHRRVRGSLRYTSDQPARRGAERGREDFLITEMPDGSRTLRAYVEIDDPPPVMRDVTLSLDRDWKPTDVFVRLAVGGAFMGSSWFRFTDSGIECEGVTASDGRLSQRTDLATPARAFGTHPIQADAWLTRLARLDAGSAWQFFPDFHLCSLDHRGATGPSLVRHPLGIRVAFLGRETLTVAAGCFEALHFQIGEGAAPPDVTGPTRNEPGHHPPYDLWTTADDDYICLKAAVTGYMMTAYELVSLSRDPVH